MTKKLNENTTDRATLIRIIRSPLSFYVLIAIIMEAVLGVLMTSGEDDLKTLYAYGFVLVILLLVCTVTILAYFKPESLLGKLNKNNETEQFCKRISGRWWEKLYTDDKSTALSYLTIQYSSFYNSVQMSGLVHDDQLEKSADWESEACCINYVKRKVFYYWTGTMDNPQETHGGFGEMTFDSDEDKITRGKGFFSDAELSSFSSVKRKKAVLRKCTDKEIKIMNNGSPDLKKELLKAVLYEI